MYIFTMEFEWDENKNQSNQQKHDISFEEASEIFRYPTYEIADTSKGLTLPFEGRACMPRQDYGEVRCIGIGRNNQMLVLTVVFTDRESRIRIISARRSNKNERKLYYEYCT